MRKVQRRLKIKRVFIQELKRQVGKKQLQSVAVIEFYEQMLKENKKPKIGIYCSGRENLRQASLPKITSPYPFCILYN